VVIILIFLSSISLTSISLRERRRNNGFRVLMHQSYLDQMSDFIMGFLKASKIQDNVKTLTTCINDLISTFSNLSVATQNLNNSPNLVSFMGILTTFNDIYKNSANKQICGGASNKFRAYLDTNFINNPQIGNNDANQYFNNVYSLISNKSARVWYDMYRASQLFKKSECYRAGEILGTLFDKVLRLTDMSVVTSTFENFNQLVTDTTTFNRDVDSFKTKFVLCQNSVTKLMPDIYGFYNETIDGTQIIPRMSDLIKSIYETSHFIQCVDGINVLMVTLNSANYAPTTSKTGASVVHSPKVVAKVAKVAKVETKMPKLEKKIAGIKAIANEKK